MRTTLDLPDPIFRDLKSRAAQQGLKLKELVQQYVMEGLRGTDASGAATPQKKWELPSFDGGGIKVPLENLKDISYEDETMRSFGRDLD